MVDGGTHGRQQAMTKELTQPEASHVSGRHTNPAGTERQKNGENFAGRD